MITPATLAARLETVLDPMAGADLDRRTIAEAVLEILALDSDQMITLPRAPEGMPADHFTVAWFIPFAGASRGFVEDLPALKDWARARFNPSILNP